MKKDLTNSRLDRQNILNNEMAIEEIQNKSGVEGIVWNNKLFVTREMTAKFFDVDVRTISRYLEQNGEELSGNGYEVLRGKNLKSFLDAARNFGKDINVPTKTTVLGVFDFRAFLNMATLLSESEKARALRQLMLDVVIDLINRKTGGGTKYINQREKDFLFSSLQEDNYRRQFTDALKNFFCTCEFHCFADGNKRLAITLSLQFLLFNGYLGIAQNFMKITENISYHVAAGKISKELLHKIMTAIMDGSYEKDEELKLEIMNAIA